MLSETFEERLRWIDTNHYKRDSKLIIVEEKKEEGKATIFCEVCNDVIKMKFEDTGVRYLETRNVADAVLFEFMTYKSVKIHIIECTRTVKMDKWNDKIKPQFEGALLNALAFMGILGLSDIRDIIFYTAYQKDKLTPDTKNSASLRTGIQAKSLSEWLEGKVSILSIKNAHHKKLQLNENREIRITL
jgi:hypothetical protein